MKRRRVRARQLRGQSLAHLLEREALGERDLGVGQRRRRSQHAHHVADVVAWAQLVVAGRQLEAAVVLDVVAEDPRVGDEPAVLQPLGDRLDGVGRQHREDLDRARVARRVDLAEVPQPDAAGDDQPGDHHHPREVDEVLDRAMRSSRALDHQRVGDVGIVPRIVLPLALVERAGVRSCRSLRASSMPVRRRRASSATSPRRRSCRRSGAAPGRAS